MLIGGLAQRATAAHSTLVVEDRNAFEIHKDGSITKNIEVTGQRLEEEGNTWFEMQHNVAIEPIMTLSTNAVFTLMRRVLISEAKIVYAGLVTTSFHKVSPSPVG